jgi:3-phenylpropionate/cinnamic acid dioxygenase small subunit
MGTLVASAVALSVSLAAGGICGAQFAAKKEPFDMWFALLIAASSQGNPQVVKQEPFDGEMAPGSNLLVDDGTCGKGRIKQVTGGEIGAMNPRPRTRKCIPQVTK